MATRCPTIPRVVIEHTLHVAIAASVFLFCGNIRDSAGDHKIANLRVPASTNLHLDVREDELARRTA